MTMFDLKEELKKRKEIVKNYESLCQELEDREQAYLDIKEQLDKMGNIQEIVAEIEVINGYLNPQITLAEPVVELVVEKECRCETSEAPQEPVVGENVEAVATENIVESAEKVEETTPVEQETEAVAIPKVEEQPIVRKFIFPKR